MAEGQLDAQGVWIYDEDDNFDTLSQYMNKGQVAQSLAFAGVKGRLASLEDKNPVRTFTSDTARDASTGTPTTEPQRRALQDSGILIIRPDKGWIEQYYATFNATTNPGGATPAGWYPIVRKPKVVLSQTNTSIPNGSETVLGVAPGGTWTELSDLYAWHNPSTNSQQIIPKIPGLYRISIVQAWAVNGSGYRVVVTDKNGTGSKVPGASLVFPSPSIVADGSVVGEVAMNGTTDFLTLRAFQNSGGSLALTTQLTIEFLEPAR